MANVTIGDLTAATSVDGTELLEIEQSGTTKSVTAAELAALAGLAGTGTVDTSGIPAANQVSIFAGPTTIKGITGITADASGNVYANNCGLGYTATATVAGITTLTVASDHHQRFTGSTTQTCKLPVASTLTAGFSFLITNESSGTVTVQSSGGNTVVALVANSAAKLICVETSGTDETSWSVITDSGLVSDTAYDATSWNGVTDVAPSKNAVRDKIEALATTAVSDVAYDATTWDAVTTVAPSKNAVRDKIEALILGGGGNVSSSGTPVAGQLATWVSAATIQGSTAGTGVVTALGVNINAAGGFSPIDGIATLTSKTIDMAVNTIKVYTTSVSGNTTLVTADCYGGIIYVTGAATITLPTIVAGMSVTVITIGAVAVSVDPNASEVLVLDGTALTGGHKASNLSTAGDIIVLSYYAAGQWYAASNAWTDGV